MTAFENLCGDAAMTKPGGGSFAELLALLTDHDDRLPGEPGPPVLDVAMGSATGSRD
jgi:hypothetical protein